MNKNDFSHGVTSVFRRTIIVLSGLILSLVLLEAGLRLSGFILSSMQESENLRSVKQKGVYRILCLGESTTAGQYPHLLEPVLNQRNIGVRFSVIDKGQSGINTLFILRRVESYLAKYHPDMVVAMMGCNDKGVKYYEDIRESDTWLFRHCRVYRFGRILYMYLFKKLQKKDIYGSGREVLGRKPEPDDKGTAIEKATLPSEVSVDGMAKSDPKNDDKGSLETRGSSQYGNHLFEPPRFADKIKQYFKLAQFYRMLGKLSQAEDSLKKVIEVCPNCVRAYIELGHLEQEQRGCGCRQAEDFFKKAIEIDPKNANVHAELGWLYRCQGKLSQAEDILREAIACNPKNKHVLEAMASLYEEMGKPELAQEYAKKANKSGLEDPAAVTVNNYRKLKEILDRKGIKLVCVQYPMHSVEPLKKIFGKDEGVIFVDNESVFKEALKKSGYKYKEYFRDMFGGDFGHCTPKGNMLLAQNIANVILREIFKK